MRSLPWSRAACRMLLLAVVCVGCGWGGDVPPPAAAPLSAIAARLLPEPERWNQVPPELEELIVASPQALLRFINRAWMREVCRAFADELQVLPPVRLHGDAHVEQYAFTHDAHGLDDFDDSAVGPAVIDLVRFLGSVQVVAFERGWPDAPDRAAAALFDGYRRALEMPGYQPPTPAVVERLRATAPPSPVDFLDWAQSLMERMAPADQRTFDAAWPQLQPHAQQFNPAFTSEYLQVKRAGRLQFGVGSAIAPKILVRIEGPSPADDDDLIIEGKQVIALRGVPCLRVAASDGALRVIEGVEQIGRIHHPLLAVMPQPGDPPDEAPEWWVKSWDASYREVTMADLDSPDDLAEIAHDVGAQLGGTNMLDVGAAVVGQQRRQELESVTRLEPQIRELARQLAAATLEAWEVVRRR